MGVDDENSDEGRPESFAEPPTAVSVDAAIKIAQIALRDQFTRMLSAARAGLQMVDVMPALRPDTLDHCIADLEARCREIGMVGHDNARALHDLLMERRITSTPKKQQP